MSKEVIFLNIDIRLKLLNYVRLSRVSNLNWKQWYENISTLVGKQILFPEMRILAYYRSDYFLAARAMIGTGLIADFKFLAGSSFLLQYMISIQS